MYPDGKPTILKSCNDWLTIFWLVIGIVYFIVAIISAIRNDINRAIACIGVALACHARCEIQILKRKIENQHNLK